ncbi:MAG: Ribonuclease G [Verrucomicrobia subdivision 3 bacterium]|nr:Ribonuclease G [Limisphaerales bacterium]MCS1413059.1 Ribonuclease G [Limisphaerales bacterium]
MRFRPSGGLANRNRHPNRAAAKARAIAIGKKEPDEELVFDQTRHAREIQRSENIAAGVPPDATNAELKAEAKTAQRTSPRRGHRSKRRDGKREDESFAPVLVPDEKPKGIVGSLRVAADTVISKVKRMIRPVQRSHKELVVNSESLETRVAILIEGRLENFNIERTSADRQVGSIYKGRVKNLEDDLKAAFVDIGFGKNAFLHYWDIVPNSFDSGVEIVERGPKKQQEPKITHKDVPRLYPVGSEIVVQVTKGPIGTKGPRVTTNLAIPGRYLVLLPTSDQSGISRKIESQVERQRLKQIVRKLTLPEGMGVIMRTAGQEQKARYFVRDLAILLEEWEQIRETINSKPTPQCVYKEPDLVERTVRDFLTEDVERIVVDTASEYDRIRNKIGQISERSARKVKYYRESQPIFDRFGISRQIESAFSRQVYLKSGGYIVIDETEALVAIDVNTGRHKSSDEDSDSAICKVNLAAAEEICRQLRLRNMGGLIILDFIDMKSRKDQQSVYQRVKECLRNDKAKTHVLPISQLGLMEMTRQRHSESMKATAYDDCPYCQGRGHVKSSLTMSVEIQRKVGEILKRRERDKSDYQLMIVVNPTIYNRLRNEDEKFIIGLEKQYFGKLSFRSDPNFHAEEFKILDLRTNRELASQIQS